MAGLFTGTALVVFPALVATIITVGVVLWRNRKID
jgi:hypothetical protein